MRKGFLLIFLFAITLCLTPISTSAAKLLQIRSSSEIQVGDNNRTYTIKLACFDVKDSKEAAATNWLKANFKRGIKINFRPVSFKENLLIAHVSKLGSNKEIGESMAEAGFGIFSCEGV